MKGSKAVASTFKRWGLRHEPGPGTGRVCSGTRALIKEYLRVKQRTVIHKGLPPNSPEAGSCRIRCWKCVGSVRNTVKKKKKSTYSCSGSLALYFNLNKPTMIFTSTFPDGYLEDRTL